MPTTCAGRAGLNDLILPSVFEAVSADDEVVFVAQVACHQVKRRLHLAGVFRVFEVGKRLIAELALRRARLNFGRKSHSCHSETRFIPLGGIFVPHRLDVRRQRGAFGPTKNERSLSVKRVTLEP